MVKQYLYFFIYVLMHCECNKDRRKNLLLMLSSNSVWVQTSSVQSIINSLMLKQWAFIVKMIYNSPDICTSLPPSVGNWLILSSRGFVLQQQGVLISKGWFYSHPKNVYHILVFHVPVRCKLLLRCCPKPVKKDISQSRFFIHATGYRSFKPICMLLCGLSTTV